MSHLIRPREIANDYLSGKSIEWVKQQCKRYQNPEAAFKWVGDYVKGAKVEGKASS